PENVNPNIPTGEVEIAVSEVELLADAETPPFPLEEGDAVDEALRLKHRALDLRRVDMQEALALRHRVITTMREILNHRDFLELEMSFVEEDDVIEVMEAVMGAVFERGGFAVPRPPWPRMTFAEAVSRYGIDRPDTRFGLELRDLGEALQRTGFKVFADVVSGG